ncbi:MAG: glutathione S-transferase [Micavibrio sp.]|nr:glutathione S-transferase [Micavibrio sp.]
MNICPILYSFRRCPYAMRARLAIKVSQNTVELREIVLRDKPMHMLEISPKGTVPVLLLPDDSVIDESLDIMLWALSQNDPENWLENSTESLDLIARNDQEFKPLLDRYKYPARFENVDEQLNYDSARIILQGLNERIASKGYLIDTAPRLADFAIFPFIRQFAHVDRDRFNELPFPALQNWLEMHKQSSLFKSIMPKFKLWTPGSEPLFF